MVMGRIVNRRHRNLQYMCTRTTERGRDGTKTYSERFRNRNMYRYRKK